MRPTTLPADQLRVETPVPHPPPTTPNETLATLIVEELIRQGLLDSAGKQDVSAKLAQGSAKQDDWHGWIKDSPRESTEEPSHGPD